MNVQGTDLWAILPGLIPAGAAALILGTDILFRRGAPRGLLEFFAMAGVLAALAALLSEFRSGPMAAFGGAARLDGLAKLLSLAILSATLLTLLLAANLSRRFHVPMPECLGLLLLTACGMVFLCMASELVTMFVAVEILSLGVYVLTGITRRSPESNEASMKYLVIGSVGSAFLVFGMVIVYGVAGSFAFDRIREALSPAAHTNGTLVAGLALLLVGFGFKIGAVPFHVWVPDAYQGAPVAVTAFMSVAVKAAAFAALVRTFVENAAALAPLWGWLAAGLSAITIVAGNWMAMGQTSVKRMLAYSSIAHTGYALMGIAAAGLGAPEFRTEASSAVGFYMLAYTFMTLGAFAMLAYTGTGQKDAETFDDFAGLSRSRPLAAFWMALFMFSLAGFPPTGGFLAKFAVFRAAIQAGQVWLVLIAVAGTILSVYYYLRVVVQMYLVPGKSSSRETDSSVGWAVGLAGFFTLLLGVYPRYLQLARDLLSR